MNPRSTYPPASVPTNTVAWHSTPTSHSSLPVGHGVPSLESCTPTRPSPITTASPTRGTADPISPEPPETFQSAYSTVTSTATETIPTPVSITEVVNGHLVVSAPPFITSTAMTTLANGTVVSLTQVIANPSQDASRPSTGHSIFGNHAVVTSVFLLSGMVIAFMVVLAVYLCRRRQRQTQRKIQDTSLPLPQNPFTMREHTSSHRQWDRFVRPGNQTTPTQSSSSILLNRSENSLPTAHGIIDAPLPPLPAHRTQNRLSYRVPVPYAGLGERGTISRTADRQYAGPSNNDYHQVQAFQNLPFLNVPPPPPKRSPLRLLVKNHDPKMPQENPNRHSGTSSLSLYPPSLYPLETEVDSLYLREVGLSRSRDTSSSSLRDLSSPDKNPNKEQRGNMSKNSNTQATNLGGVDYGTSSYWKTRITQP